MSSILIGRPYLANVGHLLQQPAESLVIGRTGRNCVIPLVHYLRAIDSTSNPINYLIVNRKLFIVLLDFDLIPLVKLNYLLNESSFTIYVNDKET